MLENKGKKLRAKTIAKATNTFSLGMLYTYLYEIEEVKHEKPYWWIE